MGVETGKRVSKWGVGNKFNPPKTPLPPGWSVRKSDADGHIRIHSPEGVALPILDHPAATAEQREALAEYNDWQRDRASLGRALEGLKQARKEKEK
jgi:hypothetical protein